MRTLARPAPDSMARIDRCRRAVLVAASSLVLVLGACDSGPSGPGSMVGRVSGAGLGAVVMEVEGAGIRSVGARGSTQAYFASVPGRENVYRVILIDAVGGELGFQIDVDDRAMDAPIITLFSAAGTDNVVVSVGEVAVTLER